MVIDILSFGISFEVYEQNYKQCVNLEDAVLLSETTGYSVEYCCYSLFVKNENIEEAIEWLNFNPEQERL